MRHRFQQSFFLLFLVEYLNTTLSCRESNISCLLGTGQDVLILLYIYELDCVIYSHPQKSWVKSKEASRRKVNFYFDHVIPSIFVKQWWIDLICFFFFFSFFLLRNVQLILKWNFTLKQLSLNQFCTKVSTDDCV